MSRTDPGIDQAAIIGRRIVRLMTSVMIPVHTDAAHTHYTVVAGSRPPVSAACKISAIGPANEMNTAISPAFQAEKDVSRQAAASRWTK